MNLLNPSFFLGPYAGGIHPLKSTPTPMIPRSEVERLLADTAVYEGKPLEQGRTSNRSGGEAQQAAPVKKPRRNTETQNQPQKINEPTTK